MKTLQTTNPGTPLWTSRFAFEMALKLEGSGEDIADILSRHSLKASDLLLIKRDSTFIRAVREYRDEIRQKGLTFRLKARAQAEELLTTSWLLIHNSDVSPAVKADLIKSVVKWAGLDTTPAGENTSGQGVSITINLGETTEPRVINGN